LRGSRAAPAVNAKSLSKSYGGTVAVNGLDLCVEPGQVFGFLGPNGAGKSTTIKLLTTLIRPSPGSLEILGTDTIKNPLSVRSKTASSYSNRATSPRFRSKSPLTSTE